MRLDSPGLSGSPPTIPPTAATTARTAPETLRNEPGSSRRRVSGHRTELPLRPLPDEFRNDRQDRLVQRSSYRYQRQRNFPASGRRNYLLRVERDERDDEYSRRLLRCSRGVVGNRVANVHEDDQDDEDDEKKRPRTGCDTAFHVSAGSVARTRSHEFATSIDGRTKRRRRDPPWDSFLSRGKGDKDDVPLSTQRRNGPTCRSRRGPSRPEGRRSDAKSPIHRGEPHRSEKSSDLPADLSDPRRSAEASSVPFVDVLVVAYTAFIRENGHHRVEKLCSRPETNDSEGKQPWRFEVHRFLEKRVEKSKDEITKVSSSEIQLLPKTTACIHVPGGYPQCSRRNHLPARKVAKRPRGTRNLENENGQDEPECTRRRRSNNTACFPDSIAEGKTGGSFHDFQKDVHSERKRPWSRGSRYVGKNYRGLFFILYLLAWPLLCLTAPTNTRATSVSPLTQNPVIRQLGGNLTRQQQERNGSFLSAPNALAPQSLYVKDSGVKDMAASNNRSTKRDYYRFREEEDDEYQGDQSVGLEPKWLHPYNEYTWEVNQINPWLSACDLAGPAPADLQGSCSPPFAPNSCPRQCRRNAAFQEVIEHFQSIEGFEFARAADGKWLSAKRNRTQTENQYDHRTKMKTTLTTTTTTTTMKIGPDGTRTTAPEQCLFYLEESHKRDVCRDDFGRGFLTPRENRYWYMSGLRLRHCCEHAVVNALAPGKGGPLEDVLNGGPRCHDALDKLLLLDDLAARLHCKFEEVLARYDCAQPYSVIYNCTHCKEAYRRWVCSSLVPYFAHEGPLDLEPSKVGWTGDRIRPCRSVCQSVEQRCPYLLPGDRAPAYPTQYAGEPTFLCRDSNIPETGEQAARALHSTFEDDCCFRYCSEHEPGSGICANCTDQELQKLIDRTSDVSTAPHCESAMPQSGPADPQQSDVSRTDDSSDSSNATLGERQESSTTWPSSQRGTSFCGGGGVGTMLSSSSAGTGGFSWLLWLCALALSIYAGQDVSRFLREPLLERMIVGLPTLGGYRSTVETGSSGSRTNLRVVLANLLGRLRRVDFRWVSPPPVFPRTAVKWCRGWCSWWCCWWWCWWWYWCWWWWSSWRKRRKCGNDPRSSSASSVGRSLPHARRRSIPNDRPRRLSARRTEKPSGRERPRRSRRRGRRRRGKPPDFIERSSPGFPKSPRITSKKDPP